MAHNSDWLPTGRTSQLAFARNWQDVLQTNSTKWQIPTTVVGQLRAAADTAESILAAAQSETTRTPVVTAQCKEAFNALTALMRDIKKRYFYVPPLLDSDLISLGLKPRDTTPTPSGIPTAQATIETYLVGRHELGAKIIYVTGNPADAANKGYQIWYSVIGQGETAPTAPEDLHTSFYTKRKKDVIEFGFNDSGKTAWMAVQIENEGKKGPWGPLVSALIP